MIISGFSKKISYRRERRKANDSYTDRAVVAVLTKKGDDSMYLYRYEPCGDCGRDFKIIDLQDVGYNDFLCIECIEKRRAEDEQVAKAINGEDVN